MPDALERVLESIDATWAREWLLRRLSGVFTLEKNAEIQAHRCESLPNVYFVVASISLGDTFADPNLHLGYLVWLSRGGEIRFEIMLYPVGIKGLFERAEVDSFLVQGDNLLVKYRLPGRQWVKAEVTFPLSDVTSSLRGYKN
jgi:hypothetical protein